MSDILIHIKADLSSHIDSTIVDDILESYAKLLTKHRASKLDEALVAGGRFVEHILRAIEYVRTNKILSEIKSVAATNTKIENDTSLPETLRLLIPRALYGMVYNIRSKRNAVHVKEIDPRGIDVAMSVAAASWVLAELVRIYHVSDEKSVARCMLVLSRTAIPFIESVGGEIVVGKKVPPRVEILLLLAHANSDGLTRNAIGKMAKCSASSVTKSLQGLVTDRLAHQSEAKSYFIMSDGETVLAKYLAEA